MRDMPAAEGDGCMWNCRLLIQHHCRYCERERERRPVPGESLSDSSPALGPEVTVSRGSPVGVFARTQFSLSLHFSKSGREVSFWIFFKTVSERRLPFLKRFYRSQVGDSFAARRWPPGYFPVQCLCAEQQVHMNKPLRLEVAAAECTVRQCFSVILSHSF